MVAKGVEGATAPAETAGQGKWSSKTSMEQQSVEVGRVGGDLAVGDGCECSAGVRAGLGFEQCSAGWIEALDEFLTATGVGGGSRGLLPPLPNGGGRCCGCTVVVLAVCDP